MRGIRSRNNLKDLSDLLGKSDPTRKSCTRKRKLVLRIKNVRKGKNLIWVYPPNNWVSKSSKTFVYGFCNPKAKLFVSSDEYLIPIRINVFPNGNFAKVINLSNVKNTVRLIQIFKDRRTEIKRRVYIEVGHNEKKQRSKEAEKKEKSSQVKRFTGSVVVIDPGHGGKEHGTHSPKGIPESYFNLQISKLLYKELKKYFKKVYLTRDRNKFVTLEDRVKFAKKKKCSFLISIHHNALPDNEDPLKHFGAGVYYAHNFVKPLAKKLLHCICKEAGLKQYGILKRNFALTRPHFCKAVLIECGFLTHPIEAEYVIKKEIQERIVSGIVKGLECRI